MGKEFHHLDQLTRRVVKVNQLFILWDSYSGHELSELLYLAQQKKIDPAYVKIFREEYLGSEVIV
jgi:hypothetical protein